MKDANEFYCDMSQMKTDIEQIKETISKMQAQIDVIEDRIYTLNPQCFSMSITAASPECFTQLDTPLSLSAARSLYPMLQHEFDNYCMRNKLTVWTSTDSLDFYNKYIGLGADFPETFNDTQNG